MMPAIIEYIIKISICLSVVYIFYQLFLRRLTFYNWNRWYLLGYSALSFIIPLVDIMPQLQKRELESNAVLDWIPAWGTPLPQKSLLETLTSWDWALIVVSIGILFFLVRFLIKLYSFLLLKKNAELISAQQTLLYQLNENITPFSFGNAIYINRHLHNEDELQEIIRHEFVHVKQKHTIDIIFCELLCITNWFNPFAWLLRHSVKQNLEFIADDKVVQNGFDKKEYQYLLLKVMGNKQLAFTNHFNFSNLKKRIAMMNTLKTAKVHLIKFLFLLPVVAVLLLSFRKEIHKAEVKATHNFVKDTVPDTDSGYKISVFTTTGGFKNPKINRTVIERMSVEDWNQNKEFYEKKYGKAGIITIKERKNNDGEIVKFDSVYVTKYKPQPIPENVLYIIDGKESSKPEVEKLNPTEIQSINVLKDKSATALYGDKGKNGVIIITSKKSHTENKEFDKGGYQIKADTLIFRGKNDDVIEFKGNVAEVEIADAQNEMIDASQKVPKNYSEVVVMGYKKEKQKDNNLTSIISVTGSENPHFVLDGKVISRPLKTLFYNLFL